MPHGPDRRCHVPRARVSRLGVLLHLVPESLQGRPFRRQVLRLKGPKNRALGVMKETVFEDSDLPVERDAALEYLDSVKSEVLADAENDWSEAIT